MIAVIFEVQIKQGYKAEYLALASELKSLLNEIDGFISIERFESLSQPGKLLSLSFWRDEEAVIKWRKLELHRHAQAKGRKSLFDGYRLRVAGVMRDYGMTEREQAPTESCEIHG